MDSRRDRMLLVLALLASFAFGYPVLAVVDALAGCCLRASVALYMFLSWALVIAVAAALVLRRGEGGR